MSRGDRIKQYIKDNSNSNSKERINGLEIICMPPIGDCFYCAVELALENASAVCHEDHCNLQKSIHFMRAIVSDAVTEDIFTTYKIYYESEIEGYEFMKHCENLEQLKEQIKKTAKQVKKNEDVIWADIFAVQTISNFYQMSFLIFNEQKKISTTIIKPNSSKSNHGFILLHLNRRNHYNIIGFNINEITQFFFTRHSLPPVIFNCFNLADEIVAKNSHLPSIKRIQQAPPSSLSPSVSLPTDPSCINNKLSLDLLSTIFSFFSTNCKESVLANVCALWRKIVYQKVVIDLSPPQKKTTPKNKIQVSQTPNQYLMAKRLKVPKLFEYITSIEMSTFERGWMEEILSILPNLECFTFVYGGVLKYHFPNPELKILTRSKASTLKKLNLIPAANATPIRFNGCGFRSICKCKNLEVLRISLSSDTTNIILQKLLPKPKLKELYLLDCKSVTAPLLASFVDKLKDQNLQITVVDSPLSSSQITEIITLSNHRVRFNSASLPQLGKRKYSK